MCSVSEVKNRAIAIFGGTFDPVHFGHLRTAIEVRDFLSIEDFRFLPAGVPVHRINFVTEVSHRLEMLKLVMADLPGFTIDEREILRSGASYMVDSLQGMRAQYGEVPLILVIGQDAANSLQSWHRWKELFPLTNLLIISRPGDKEHYASELRNEIDGRWVTTAAELLKGSAGTVLRLEVTGLAISSSKIRKMLHDAQSPRYLLPDAVIEYIELHSLYQ